MKIKINENTSINAHPTVILPKLIADYLQKQKINLPVYEQPIAPTFFLIHLKYFQWFVLGLITLILPLSHFLSWNQESLLIFSLSIIGLAWGIKRLEQYEQTIYRQKLKIYQKKLKQWQATQSLLQRYQKRQKQSYKNNRLTEFKQLLEGKVRQPIAADFEISLIYESFQKLVVAQFGQQVVTGRNFLSDDSKIIYQQPLALVEPRSGLHFHLEITDDLLDKEKKRFLLCANWIIVQFTEEQVLLNPELCCQELARILTRITL